MKHSTYVFDPPIPLHSGDTVSISGDIEFIAAADGEQKLRVEKITVEGTPTFNVIAPGLVQVIGANLRIK